MRGDRDYNRQTLRLPGQDYSEEGNYFVTICTENHILHFGAIFNGQMILNEIGQVAKEEWFKLPDRFSQIRLGPFCIMPNHLHGLIQITGLAPAHDGDGQFHDGDAPAHDGNSPGLRAEASPAPTEESIQQKEGEKEKVALGNIVGAYKSLVMKACLVEHKAKFPSGLEMPLFGKIWQRNYYEHIIRTQKSFDQIAAYIVTNPQNWAKDKFYFKFE